MAYLLGNNCTKNYRNRTTILKDVVEVWVVCSFFATQCIRSESLCVSVYLLLMHGHGSQSNWINFGVRHPYTLRTVKTAFLQ